MYSLYSFKQPGCQEREFLSCMRLYFCGITFGVFILQGYEAASLSKRFPTFRDNVAVTSSWIEMHRFVGNRLVIDQGPYHGRTEMSIVSVHITAYT